MIDEVNDGAVEAVRDRRTGRTRCRVFRPEHDVIDEQLTAAIEQLRQRARALVGREAVLLVDPNPRQLLALPRELIAQPRVLLLAG